MKECSQVRKQESGVALWQCRLATFKRLKPLSQPPQTNLQQQQRHPVAVAAAIHYCLGLGWNNVSVYGVPFNPN